MLLAANRKIEAVKQVREDTGLSLKDAMAVVELLEANDDRKLVHFQRAPFPPRQILGADRVGVNIARVFLAVGFLLFAIGMTIAYNTDQKITHSQRVKGRVVALASRSSGFRPVVTYTHGGKSMELEGSVSSNPPMYEVGEAVDVYIPHDSAQPPFIGSTMELWLAAMILGGIGTIFLLIGGGLLFAFRKF